MAADTIYGNTGVFKRLFVDTYPIDVETLTYSNPFRRTPNLVADCTADVIVSCVRQGTVVTINVNKITMTTSVGATFPGEQYLVFTDTIPAIYRPTNDTYVYVNVSTTGSPNTLNFGQLGPVARVTSAGRIEIGNRNSTDYGFNDGEKTYIVDSFTISYVV